MKTAYDPNDRKVEIHLILPKSYKKWLEDHPWVNVSGLLRNAIDRLRFIMEQIKEEEIDELFKS